MLPWNIDQSQVQKANSGTDEDHREKLRPPPYFKLRNNLFLFFFRMKKYLLCFSLVFILLDTRDIINWSTNIFTIRFVFPPHRTLWSSTQNRVLGAPCQGLLEECLKPRGCDQCLWCRHSCSLWVARGSFLLRMCLNKTREYGGRPCNYTALPLDDMHV